MFERRELVGWPSPPVSFSFHMVSTRSLQTKARQTSATWIELRTMKGYQKNWMPVKEATKPKIQVKPMMAVS